MTQDRKRLQHLLALTEPVEQEITYARQGRPDTFHLLPKQPAMGGHNATCVLTRRVLPAQPCVVAPAGARRFLKSIHTGNLVCAVKFQRDGFRAHASVGVCRTHS